MDPNLLPKGQSTEKQGDGRPLNQPGIYRHKAAKKELITASGADGVIQADALIRVGYERIGDVPSRQEILAMQKAQLEKDKKNPEVGPSDPGTGGVHNGTVTRSAAEVEAELAETRATLAALKAGLENKKPKEETKSEQSSQ
jgi:hypothetical protein